LATRKSGKVAPHAHPSKPHSPTRDGSKAKNSAHIATLIDREITENIITALTLYEKRHAVTSSDEK
jgi:hypothetical protein